MITPTNPFNEKLVSGGSSSGSAVSVSRNYCLASIGSDTGGSVRIPAAWNNLVGLKTTHNLIDLSGVLKLCPSFDTLGPICRNVDDANAPAALQVVGPGDFRVKEGAWENAPVHFEFTKILRISLALAGE